MTDDGACRQGFCWSLKYGSTGPWTLMVSGLPWRSLALPAVTRRAGLGRLGVVGGWIGAAGLVAMGVESGVGVVHRVDALGVLFGLGILLSLLGLLLLAVAGLVAGTPRWLATLPLAAVVAAAAGGEVGASIVSAALWLVLARRIAAPEPVASAPAGSRAAASTA